MDDESAGLPEAMLSESVLDEEVITFFDAIPSDIDNGIFAPLQPPSCDVDTNLDLTENHLQDFVTLSPAVISSESFSVTAAVPDFLACSDYSPSSSSSFSLNSPENPESIIYSPSSNTSGSEETDFMVSPSEVFHDEQIPLKKKRGRKPKSGDDCFNPASKNAKTKRLRIYEIKKPFEDKEQERKRVNAIKAKRHRDSQKKIVQELQQQIVNIKAERDKLKQERDWLKREVHSLRSKDYDAEREMQKKELENERRKVAEITHRYEVHKRHWLSQASRIMKLLKVTPEF